MKLQKPTHRITFHMMQGNTHIQHHAFVVALNDEHAISMLAQLGTTGVFHHSTGSFNLTEPNVFMTEVIDLHAESYARAHLAVNDMVTQQRANQFAESAKTSIVPAGPGAIKRN